MHLLTRQSSIPGVHLLTRQSSIPGVHLLTRQSSIPGVHVLTWQSSILGVHVLTRQSLTGSTVKDGSDITGETLNLQDSMGTYYDCHSARG